MLTVIVPVYNEAAVVGEFHTKLCSAMDGAGVAWEALYVDDGSRDRSADELAKLSGARVVRHEYNRGYGAAIKTGILNSTSELIAIIDCDGTYDPSDLLTLYRRMDECEMAVGARPHRANFNSLSKHFLRALASYAVSQRIPDLNSGLRIFRRDLAMRLIHLLPDGFSLTSTITLGAFYLPARVCYLPISYGKRVGRSKIRPLKAFTSFVLLILRIMVLFNPLRFFLPASAFLGLVGLGFLTRDLLSADVAQTSILLLTNSFVLFAVGLLAEAVRWKK